MDTRTAAGTDAEPVGPTTDEREDRLAGFADRADDLDEIKKCVNDAASTSGALWISYLFVLLYTAIAAGAVTPVDLFMENPVKLPFLGIDLPLKAFFLLAPLLFLITHVYTLMSFAILSDKAKWYHRELKRQIELAGTDAPARAQQIQDDLRRHLVSNIFVQFLAGPSDLRCGPFGAVLKLIAWTTLVLAPAALLLLLQVQFLPYHARGVTWAHRLVLLLDLAAIWWLWYRILAGRLEEAPAWRRWSAKGAQSVSILMSVLLIVFSWTIATFPGEWQETALKSPPTVLGAPSRGLVALHAYVFARRINPTTRRRDGFFTSTLILPVFNIYEQLKIDDPAKVAARFSVFSARGRDLREAVFDLSNLSQIDFEGSNLQGASLDRAILHATSLYCTDLRGASMYQSQLQSAWFHAADLRGAQMQDADGQAARFEGADLRTTHLETARLEAARFDGADMREATFANADLRGASFVPMAKEGPLALTGHCVNRMRREAAAAGANLGQATLSSADLEEASLRGASLDGASLDKARLDGADLSFTKLGEAKLTVEDGAQTHGILMQDTKWGDPAADRSPVAAARAALLSHAVAAPLYQQALGRGLIDLVCTDDPSAAFIVRGLLENRRLRDAGASASTAIDAILKDGCTGDATLASDDKARLIALKRKLATADPR